MAHSLNLAVSLHVQSTTPVLLSGPVDFILIISQPRFWSFDHR